MSYRLNGVSPEFIAKIKSDIVAILYDNYELIKEVLDVDPKSKTYRRFKALGTGVFVKGNSVSFIKSELSWNGYKNLGNTADFEDTIRALGFGLEKGKNSRGNKGLVVFVK